MKIIYVNCRVKNLMKDDHRSYMLNLCSCENDAFFSGFLFATAKVAYITAMIILHLILHSAVHIYDFHIFITS